MLKCVFGLDFVSQRRKKKEMNVFRDIKCFAKYFCIISQLCILSTIKKVQLFGFFFVLLFSFCEIWNTYF